MRIRAQNYGGFLQTAVTLCVVVGLDKATPWKITMQHQFVCLSLMALMLAGYTIAELLTAASTTFRKDKSREIIKKFEEDNDSRKQLLSREQI